MDSVLRAAGIYIGLLVIMRLTGKRSLAQLTPFDFIVLLLIGEASQQALLGDDFSLTNAFLVITTLLGIDLLFSLVSFRIRVLGKVMNGVPLVVVIDGQPIAERMHKSRLSNDDILAEARRSQGIERMEEIKYAVLEKSGGISIIPRSRSS